MKGVKMVKQLQRWVIAIVSFSLVLAPLSAHAGSPEGLSFLESKQIDSGAITGGYSNPSQWAAVAFTAHGINTDTVKSGSASLYDYLQADVGSGSAADIEARMLAIHAVGGDSTSFGGVNYLTQLEALYDGTQLGDASLLNDDMFGLLALISAGSNASSNMKTQILSFIVAHQAPSGAFSYCTDYTAQWCDPSADLTGAALQALQVAKNNGITTAGQDAAITSALGYLNTNQNGDGGYGYFGSSDADSTAWVLMALNLSSPGSAQQTSANAWLLGSQQPDGGFPSFSGSDSTTTAYALIALSGNGWLVEQPISTTPGRGGVDVTPAEAQPVVTPASTPVVTPAAVVPEVPAAVVAAVAANPAKNDPAKLEASATKPAEAKGTSYKWGFAAVSAASFLGALIYALRYNRAKV